MNLFLAQDALEQEGDNFKAKALAYCDGEEYKYKVAHEEAKRFLENLM